MRKGFILLFIIAVFSSYSVIGNDSLPISSNIALEVNPGQINVNLFYHSSEITIRSVVPDSVDFVLLLTGGDQSVPFRKKGRRGGLWLTVGEVLFHHAPKLYRIFSNLTYTELRRRFEPDPLPFGKEALKRKIRIEGAGADSSRMLEDFFKLKMKTRLYTFFEKPLEDRTVGKGRVIYETKISLPSNVPVGTYHVQIIPLKGTMVMDPIEQTITVKKTGFVKTLSDMAQKHAALYGILAILVAIIFGFLVGVFFNAIKKRKI